MKISRRESLILQTKRLRLDLPMMVADVDQVVFAHFFLTKYLEVPVVLVTGLEATVTVLALADHLQGVLLVLLGDGV